VALLLVSIDSAETVTTLAQAAGVIAVAYLAVLWLAGVAWVAGDVGRRTRDPGMRWFAIAMAGLFFLPGILVYVAIRPAETLADRAERQLETQMLARQSDSAPSCGNCHRHLREEFVRCPYCAWKLGEHCQACQRVNAAEWVVCPYCGNGREPVAATSTRQRAGYPTTEPKVAVGGRSRNGLTPVS
jgi:RNA polymerase subunit RPABC4/transcription elongation factor Spt4